MDHGEHCDRLAAEVERFAVVTALLQPTAEVRTCPGWDVAALCRHLGTVHRWVEDLVRTAAPGPKPRPNLGSDDEDDPGPDWIRRGGAALLETLRAADPDRPMWAWGADQHVRFWSRRMVHETVVHRADAELAAGVEPSIDAAVAADGIDELLANLPAALARRADDASALRGNGEVLAIRVEGAGPAGPGSTPGPGTTAGPGSTAGPVWGITLGREGFAVGADPGGRATAALAGGAAGLLLVLQRRRVPDAVGVRVEGDAALVDRWLAHTAI